MKENFLQFIWDRQLLDTTKLVTIEGKSVKILNKGIWNKNSGADFSNAKIKIEDIVFFGDIEIHKKSSDWYKHNHQKDKNYNKVILHIVWENDEYIIQNKFKIPTVKISKLIDKKYINNFKSLLDEKYFLKCRKFISKIDEKDFQNIYLKFYKKRLNRKTEEIYKDLEALKNDWEGILFLNLFKYFWGTVNKNVFKNVALDIGFNKLKKEINSIESLESIFYGQFGLLDIDISDEYFINLKNKYNFLKNKYNLNKIEVDLKFSKMRPSSFPTIRISQFCNLYFKHKTLFNEILKSENIINLKNILSTKSSKYWDNYYSFGKKSKKEIEKKLSNRFKDLVIINVVIPILFAYSKLKNDIPLEEKIINLIYRAKPKVKYEESPKTS